MKTKLFITILLLPFVLLSHYDIENNISEKNSSIKEKPPKKRRYRLDDQSKNYYDLNDNKIRIELPVTSRKLQITNWIENISSNKINAVLIWVKARNISGTQCEGEYKTKTKRIRISKLRGLKKQLEEESNNKLLVAFWIDEEEPTYELENMFRETVRNASSYEDAVEIINKGNCNDSDSIFKYIDVDKKPAESGGDVIGGNG